MIRSDDYPFLRRADNEELSPQHYEQGSNSPRRIRLEFQARLGSGEKPNEPSLNR